MFPLPEKAAVDHLRMQIGERVIEGQIKERSEARRTYEAAKAEGRKATLVEQERPNMFTTSVAQHRPDEEIVVAIEYQETLRYDDGRVPRCASRWRSRRATSRARRSRDGERHRAGRRRRRQVLDADRITPPVVDRARRLRAIR